MRSDPADEVTDASDARVDDFRSLTDTPRQRALERPGPFSSGRLIVEGVIALSNTIGGAHGLRRVLCTPPHRDRVETIVGDRAPVLVAERPILDQIVGFPLHRGVVASVDRARPTPWTDLAARCRTALVIEGVNDAENMGVLMRNGRGLGAGAVFLDTTSVDPLVRRAIRVSQGHSTRQPHARAPIDELLSAFASREVATVALAPSGRPLAELPHSSLGPERRVAVLVGAEGPGLDDATIEACDHVASIPMADGVDSLNVASAAAIAMAALFPAPRGGR